MENLKSIFGEFRYAPYRTFPDPANELKTLQTFLPKYKGVKSYSSGIKRKQYRESLEKNNELKSQSKDENGKELPLSNTETNKLDNVDDVKENKSSNSNEQQEKSEIHNEKSENHHEKSENDHEKPVDETPKKNSESDKNDDNFLNISSPEHKDDHCMEGYGTDDDSVSEINLEKRRELVHKKTSEYNDEEKMEEEDEDDTQVPNNISLDRSSSKSVIRTRGGVHHTPGTYNI